MNEQSFSSDRQENILTQVHEGMTVYDRDNNKVGTVESIYLGALSGTEEWSGTGPATEDTMETYDEPGVMEDFAFGGGVDPRDSAEGSETLRNRLQRHGYVRMESTGLLASDRYILPEQIASVAEDRLNLQVSKDELIKA